MDDPFRELMAATRDAALRGPGTTPPELRQALAGGEHEPPEALRALVDKIRTTPWAVTDADWAPLADYTEDQRFEIVIAATLGAAHTRFEAALRALEGA